MATKLTGTHSAPVAVCCCSRLDSRKCGLLLLLLPLLLLLGKYKISAANANVTAAAHGQVHPLPLVTRAAALSRGPVFMRAAKRKRRGKGGSLTGSPVKNRETASARSRERIEDVKRGERAAASPLVCVM